VALELNAIERSCLRTSGGIKQIVLIDPDDLNTQPDWYVAPSIADLDFASGKAAYAFQHQRFTATLTDETPIDAQAGDYFTYRLTAFIRVIRAEVELLRAKLLNRRTHVIATYMDGSQRFLPNMRLTGKGDSGARYGKDSPGVQFTGALRLNRPAPFVAADIDVIGGPYVPPDTGATGAVTTIEIITSDSAYSYTIPAGKWLVGWEVKGDTDQIVNLGTTAGGSDLGSSFDLSAGSTWVGQGNMLPTFTSQTIYFSGLEGTNNINLWLIG